MTRSELSELGSVNKINATVTCAINNYFIKIIFIKNKCRIFVKMGFNTQCGKNVLIALVT